MVVTQLRLGANPAAEHEHDWPEMEGSCKTCGLTVSFEFSRIVEERASWKARAEKAEGAISAAREYLQHKEDRRDSGPDYVAGIAQALRTIDHALADEHNGAS